MERGMGCDLFSSLYWVLTYLRSSVSCQTLRSVPDPSRTGGDRKAVQPRSSPWFQTLPSVSLFMCESWCCAGEAVPRVSWASGRRRPLSLSRGAVACSTGGVLKKLRAAANTLSSCCMMGVFTPVAPTAAVSWAMTREDGGQVTDINWCSYLSKKPVMSQQIDLDIRIVLLMLNIRFEYSHHTFIPLFSNDWDPFIMI